MGQEMLSVSLTGGGGGGGSGEFHKCFSLMKLCDFFQRNRLVAENPSWKWNLNSSLPRNGGSAATAGCRRKVARGEKNNRVGNLKVGALKRQQINLIKFTVNILYLLWKLASLVPCAGSQQLNYSARFKAKT